MNVLVLKDIGRLKSWGRSVENNVLIPEKNVYLDVRDDFI